MTTPAVVRLGARLRANPQTLVSAMLAAALLWSAVSMVHTSAMPLRVAAPQRTVVADWRLIHDAHLFGTRAGDEAVGDPAGDATPLVLVGTLTNANPSAAYALVRRSDQPVARLYRVGDLLPGGATLVEVRAHSILISRTGGSESLAFARKFSGGLAALSPGAVETDELAEADAAAIDAQRIFTKSPNAPPVEDYYAEQQAELARSSGGS